MIIPLQNTALLHVDQIIWVNLNVITGSIKLAWGTIDLK